MMLENRKLMLEKSCYDKDLFRKEILKSFKFLKSHEIIKLHGWLKRNFGKTHSDVIRDVFEFITA
jgi:hypothetical protein